MERAITIVDQNGLHARPASLLTKVASEFDEEILLTYKDKTVPLKSILAVMSLSVPSKATVTIKVEGEAEEKVLNKIIAKFVELNLIEDDQQA